MRSRLGQALKDSHYTLPQVNIAQLSRYTYLTKETIQEFLENGLLHDDVL